MTPERFVRKWDAIVREALSAIMRAVEEAGGRVEGPFVVDEEDAPIWGFSVFPYRTPGEDPADVWLRFYEMPEEGPGRYLVSLEVLDASGRDLYGVSPRCATCA